jgi:hypothetical protein
MVASQVHRAINPRHAIAANAMAAISERYPRVLIAFHRG